MAQEGGGPGVEALEQRVRDRLRKGLERAGDLDGLPVVGEIRQVVGTLLESAGPASSVGDLSLLEVAAHRRVEAEVVGFREGRVLLMPLGSMAGVRPGCPVYRSGAALSAAVGPALLGRVLDGLGRPLDGLGTPAATRKVPVEAPPPTALERTPIRQIFVTGVRVLDGLLTLGRGQRLGLFAGSGVGKSTLLGMVARQSSAEVNVIALVGERGREVQEFVNGALGPEGLRRSVVVAATSDQSPLVRIKGAMLATAIAEGFRDEGRDVCLMMDSVTRVALAQREIGLAVGEPPTTRGYTPSVFSMLPRLLERSGTSPKGSITAIYTVLVEGDDFNEPVADAVRGILDGHVVLSRELAHANHYPAVDVLASVSRLMSHLVGPEHLEAAAGLREVLAVCAETRDLISLGAYTPGTAPEVDRALAMKPRVEAFLRQGVEEASSPDEARQQLLDLFSESAADGLDQP